MLASTIAITAVVAIGVVGWRLVAGGDDTTVGARGDWDELAVVDRSSGAVTRLDRDGAPIDTIVGLGRVNEVHAFGDHLALVGTEQIAVAAPDAESVAVPIDRGRTVTPMTTDETFHLIVGDDDGGDVTIVDGLTGEALSVGELTGQANLLVFPSTIRESEDGRRFALADAGRFRTILVSLDDEPPRYFPDQPIAVGDELIATSQVIDREADVTITDFEREPKAFATVPIPAGGLLLGDRLLIVSVDGTISSLPTDGGDVERVGVVAVPSGDTVRWVLPALDDTRLVVGGSSFEAVVELDGTTAFTTTFTTPVELLRPDPAWQCLPVGGDATFHSLVSLETGEQLADLSGLAISGTSDDGCAVLGERDGAWEVVDADGVVPLGQARDAALAPDGRTVVRTSLDGRTELLRIDDELSLEEAIDLSEHVSGTDLVAFLDR
jgi:hypothetical protein